MSNPAKRRGSTWERACADFLKSVFPFVERSPSWGSLDKGDLTGTGPFVVECKAHKSIDLASFVDEACVEARNAGRLFPVVFVKRRSKSVEEGYAVMRMEDWRAMVAESAWR